MQSSSGQPHESVRQSFEGGGRHVHDVVHLVRRGLQVQLLPEAVHCPPDAARSRQSWMTAAHHALRQVAPAALRPVPLNEQVLHGGLQPLVLVLQAVIEAVEDEQRRPEQPLHFRVVRAVRVHQRHEQAFAQPQGGEQRVTAHDVHLCRRHTEILGRLPRIGQLREVHCGGPLHQEVRTEGRPHLLADLHVQGIRHFRVSVQREEMLLHDSSPGDLRARQLSSMLDANMVGC
mmetsp:Transcript_385/g.557  ORF Transcript_385/g.557 Transcript_385/m.557 type:complete len:232 (+) Transcript_385:310-1005(+)